MRIAVSLAGLVSVAVVLMSAVEATAQEYVPAPDSGTDGYEAEAAGPHGPWVYVGRKGSFHLDNAETLDGSDSRGVFKTVSRDGTRYWSNSFVKLRTADPYFWHYQMVGYSYKVAVAKYPSWCGRYEVWTRNPAQSTWWSLFDYATRGRPRGNRN
jgi:hypothetical protein